MNRSTVSVLISGVIGLAVALPTAGTAPGAVEEECRDFSANVQVIVCAPVTSDRGGRLTSIAEDGSALYSDGRVYDAEDNGFRTRR